MAFNRHRTKVIVSRWYYRWFISRRYGHLRHHTIQRCEFLHMDIMCHKGKADCSALSVYSKKQIQGLYRGDEKDSICFPARCLRISKEIPCIFAQSLHTLLLTKNTIILEFYCYIKFNSFCAI